MASVIHNMPYTSMDNLNPDPVNKQGTIRNGNRTEGSPIRSVIIRVLNKIGGPSCGSLICLIMSMITDQIGPQEVLLKINHNFNKTCDI